VCGRPPFVGQGHGDLITMHITVPPTPPRQIEPTVPEWLEHVIMQMLVKNPDDRYGDMAEVISDLEQLGALPSSTPPPMPAGRLASGTPAPPTTIETLNTLATPTTFATSGAELMLTTPVDRSAPRWRWPVAIAGLVTVGALAFALAANAGGGGGLAGVEASPAVEVKAVETPTPETATAAPATTTPAAAPEPAAEVAAAAAELAPPVAEPAEPVAGRRSPARSKRRKPAREPAAAQAPARTRVRGGIAEPDF